MKLEPVIAVVAGAAAAADMASIEERPDREQDETITVVSKTRSFFDLDSFTSKFLVPKSWESESAHRYSLLPSYAL